MLQHIAQYWLDYLFGLITIVLSFGYRMLGKKFTMLRKENGGINNGVRALLHNKIIIMGKEFISAGYCTPEQFEEFEYLYKPYHDDLGGNGNAERIRNQVMKLPQEIPDKETNEQKS